MKDETGFKKLGGVAYCTDRSCGEMFTITSSDAFQKMMNGENMLPCGHPCSAVILSATHIKGGDNAVEMIDWLIAHDYIDSNAFRKIKAHGGVLDDGLNCRVPENKQCM